MPQPLNTYSQSFHSQIVRLAKGADRVDVGGSDMGSKCRHGFPGMDGGEMGWYSFPARAYSFHACQPLRGEPLPTGKAEGNVHQGACSILMQVHEGESVPLPAPCP